MPRVVRDRTCLKCGRVAFGVSRECAETLVSDFNDFFDSADAVTRESYGNRRSTIVSYERCTQCGNWCTNFRDAVDGDCPDGCTLSPIIVEADSEKR